MCPFMPISATLLWQSLRMETYWQLQHVHRTAVINVPFGTLRSAAEPLSFRPGSVASCQ